MYRFKLMGKLGEQQFNIKFVQEVKKHPCLYNFGLPEYSRKDANEKAWTAIGKKMEMPGHVCKEKWRNFRVVFIRHMRFASNGEAKKKKPYYLLDEMKFLTPFIMRILPGKHGNLCPPIHRPVAANTPEVPVQTQKVTDANIKHEIEDEDYDENHEVPPLNSSDYFEEIPAHIPDTSETYPEQLPASHNMYDLFMEYGKDKTPWSGGAPAVVRHEDNPTKSFLLSLLPELDEMNTTQLKSFKRRVLVLIDDIVGEPPLK